jgi:hypothetical protein
MFIPLLRLSTTRRGDWRWGAPQPITPDLGSRKSSRCLFVAQLSDSNHRIAPTVSVAVIGMVPCPVFVHYSDIIPPASNYLVLLQTILQQTSCSLLQFVVMDGAVYSQAPPRVSNITTIASSSLIVSSTAYQLHDSPCSEALMIKDCLNQTWKSTFRTVGYYYTLNWKRIWKGKKANMNIYNHKIFLCYNCL